MKSAILYVLLLCGVASSAFAQKPLPVTHTDSTDGAIYAMAIWNGRLVVGGRFSHVDSTAARNIAIQNGDGWQPLGNGVNGVVRALATDSDGALIVGGSFDSAGGVAASNIARYSTDWTHIGAGTNDTVCAIALCGKYIVCGGVFDSADDRHTGPLIAWNDTNWVRATSDSIGGIIRGLVAQPGSIQASGVMTVGSDSARFSFIPLFSSGTVDYNILDEGVGIILHRGGKLFAGASTLSMYPGETEFETQYFGNLNVGGKLEVIEPFDNKRFLVGGTTLGLSGRSTASFYDGIAWRGFSVPPLQTTYAAAHDDRTIWLGGGDSTFGFLYKA